MKLEEFILKYDDQYVDIDAMFSSQCKDLFSAYNTEVVDCPFYIYGNANELWDNAPEEYYSRENIPQKGDCVIWGTGIGQYGHVAIFIEGDTNSFTSFDQNFPIGSPCHYQGHTYVNIIGYLRPKGETMGFSDENVGLIIDRTLRRTRLLVLGKVDEQGLSDDKKSAMAKIKTGNVDVVADIIQNYFKAVDWQWIKKTDVPKDLSLELKEAERKTQENWDNFIKVEKERDTAEEQLKLCQEKPCPDVCADKSAGELIILGIRKWLGIK